MSYLSLLPVAENLISSFRLLATVESQTATNLAAEIKLAELSVSASNGAYSGNRDFTNKKDADDGPHSIVCIW